VHCDGNPHVCGPFDGRNFCRDLVSELRKLAERDEPLPYYPQRRWFVALAKADAKDRSRFISNLNARDDSTYLERQHAGPPTATSAGVIDGFSDTFTHRTAGGTTQIAPQVDTFRPAPTPYDRYHRNYNGEPQDANAPRPQDVRITLDETQTAILEALLSEHSTRTKSQPAGYTALEKIARA
jgi:hypothetical protein